MALSGRRIPNQEGQAIVLVKLSWYALRAVRKVIRSDVVIARRNSSTIQRLGKREASHCLAGSPCWWLWQLLVVQEEIVQDKSWIRLKKVTRNGEARLELTSRCQGVLRCRKSCAPICSRLPR